MRRKSRKRKLARLKTKLGLPDLEQAKAAVLASLRSRESQRSYERSLDEFVAWYCSAPRLSFNKTVVTRYRIHLEDRQLAPGTVNVRLAAVRRLAYEGRHRVAESSRYSSRQKLKLGIRLGNWLTANEARTLWQLPNADTLKGKRDRASDKMFQRAQKGPWNGGNVPYGYALENKKLIVNGQEADHLRFMFHRFAEVPSLSEARRTDALRQAVDGARSYSAKSHLLRSDTIQPATL